MDRGGAGKDPIEIKEDGAEMSVLTSDLCFLISIFIRPTAGGGPLEEPAASHQPQASAG
jgi:hypothetical protein